MTPNLKRDLIACAIAALIVSYFIVFWRGAESVGPSPDWSTEMMAAPEGLYVVVQFATSGHGMQYRTMDAYRIGRMWFLSTQEDVGDRPLTPVNLPFIAWTYGPKE